MLKLSYKSNLAMYCNTLSAKLFSTTSGPLLGAAAANAAHHSRSQIFQNAKDEQLAFHELRLTKVRVDYEGLPENMAFSMNAHLSTPYDCAKHIQMDLCNRSVVATVNGQSWDMHKPFHQDSTVHFHQFKSPTPELANITFWRSCSFLLGMVLEKAFKKEHSVHLCSFPPPLIQSGSFVYDIKLSLTEAFTSWIPSLAELHALSIIGQKIAVQDLPFEPLLVPLNTVLEMFQDNPIKCAQAQAMVEASGVPKLTVYRVGDHVDICRGPLMSSTKHVGRFMVTAFHPIETKSYGKLFRVQGLAIPREFLTHFTSFQFLAKRAAIYNEAAPLPHLPEPKANKVSAMAAGNE